MLLLGLDTATAVSTVALIRSVAGDAPEVLQERSHLDPRRHGEVLPVQIDGVLRDAGASPSDVDAVAVGTGPGAFTGLRVGLATAQAIGIALKVPVHGVSTLDALAYATKLCEPFAVVTDARRREVFWAVYSSYDTRSAPPAVGTPAAARDAIADLPVVSPPGTPSIEGLALHAASAGADGQPRAAELGLLVLDRLARGLTLEPPVPLYLRRPDVTPSSRPKSVLS